MKLTDLNPRWVDRGGDGVYNGQTGEQIPHQRGVGMTFDCPCGCKARRYIPFENPLDGEQVSGDGPYWHRTGDSFESLTLHPSILDTGSCGWHGWVRNGEVISV